MLEGNLEPLEIAKRILLPSTLEAVCRQPYTARGWTILDRWAMNTPEKIRALEAESEFLLLSRLLEQQSLETEVLNETSALERLATGETEGEILASALVNTEL